MTEVAQDQADNDGDRDEDASDDDKDILSNQDLKASKAWTIDFNSPVTNAPQKPGISELKSDKDED